MAEAIFLGVGGAMATDPADNHTALVVREAGVTVLLDCGPTVVRQLEQIGLTAGDVTHVYLSHQHGDHVLGLPMLLLNRVLFWPERPLRVMAMPPVLELAQQLAAIAYPDLADRMSRTVSYEPLAEDAGPTRLPGSDGITVAVAPGKHSVPTWGVRLNLSGGRSLVYSSDTGPCRAIARLAQGVDLLVHEAYFLSFSARRSFNHSVAAEVGELAAGAGAQALALVHREITDASAADQYRTEACKHFAGTIFVPNAGDVVVF